MKVNIKIAGTTFHKIPDGLKISVKGEDVFEENGISCARTMAVLQPEPENQYDPEAVKVLVKLTDGSAFHIGYLPKAEPLKQKVKTTTLAQVVIKDYTVMGDFNPSYLITDINMQ